MMKIIHRWILDGGKEVEIHASGVLSARESAELASYLAFQIVYIKSKIRKENS